MVGNVWPAAIVQTRILHLIRNTFHLARKKDWDALKRDAKNTYGTGKRELAQWKNAVTRTFDWVDDQA